MEQLKKLVKNYGIGLNYFDEDDPEADLLYIYRKELEENKALLSPEDLDLLCQYDLKAVELYEKYKNYDTEAVDWLKDTVQIAKANLKNKSNYRKYP
ncbi:hypothetical protein GWK41_05560 [Persephonella atlantica]|uniref:Uncharacterized protein n=1 Tax=Persephonella atlantica TaxID=2699429 RepID=A0ABS1GHZ0_9AQUI|nr:hypothetical protein [Persephonella atlantica]MBK3332527.1 hypothetical protein [Persephonella atlantica]